MKIYNDKPNPMRFGIMYSESATTTTDTVWFETEEQRLDATMEIERTGMLTINYNGSPLGKTVLVHGFTEIDAKYHYYIKIIRNVSN